MAHLELLSLWFGDNVDDQDYRHRGKLWFRADPEVDATIREKFSELHANALEGKLDWTTTLKEKLAYVVLLDQFSRNIHRGSSRMFDGDALAVKAALDLVNSGEHRQLSHPERLFVYFPLEHSEDAAIVAQSVELVRSLMKTSPPPQRKAFGNMLEIAEEHCEIVQRFGRYPHRNVLLDRDSTVEEAAFLKLTKAGFMSSVQENAGPSSQKRTRSKSPRKKGTFRISYPPDAARVLVLHSFRQNAQIMRTRTPRMRRDLADVCELVYANAPIPYTPEREVLDATIEAFGELRDTEHQRCWFHSSEGNESYQGLDTSFAYLEHLFATQGPFDGIIGFSQGGALAGILAAMQPMGSIHFDFFINISGFASRAADHQELMKEDSLAMPSLHIYGEKDILVDPERTLRLASVFTGSQVETHTGGHFTPNKWPTLAIKQFISQNRKPKAAKAGALPAQHVHVRGFLDKVEASIASAASDQAVEPRGLGPAGRAVMETEQWNKLSTKGDLTESEVDAMFTVALAASADNDAEDAIDDLLLLALTAHHELKLLNKPNGVYAVLLGAYLRDPARILPILLDLGECAHWRDLSSVVVAGGRKRKQGECSVEDRCALERLHEAAVIRFAEQLKDDVSTIEGDAGDGINMRDARWPSMCVFGAPRIKGAADKVCHFAKDIAQKINPLHEPSEALLTLEDPLCFTKGIAYERYRIILSKIRTLLEASTLEFAEKEQQRYKKARGSEAMWNSLRKRPIAKVVLDPEPEPVIPCTLEDLSPLLGWLQSGAAVDTQTAFQKGTMVPDGRLDLCKQVVGPHGIGPLLEAMSSNPQVNSLLLGNNIVGNGGAAAIADFIKQHPSQLKTWYIAGNHFDADGISAVTEALEENPHVEQLWLKRNPLRAAGMVHIGRLLKRNTYLSVLDLVNVGMMDEGVRILFESLTLASDTTALRHLYIGTNGISEEGARYVGEYLASGNNVLTSLFLSCNRVGDEGAESIAKGLLNDTTLERLSLASNRITARGVAPLCQALQQHPNLVLLDLGFTRSTPAVGELGNRLGDAGAEEVANLLRGNTRLRSLDLLHNAIGQVGVRAIRDALQENTTLTNLQLTQFNKVHNEVAREEITGYVRRNCKLWKEQMDDLQKIDLPDHINEIYSVYRTKV